MTTPPLITATTRLNPTQEEARPSEPQAAIGRTLGGILRDAVCKVEDLAVWTVNLGTSYIVSRIENSSYQQSFENFQTSWYGTEEVEGWDRTAFKVIYVLGTVVNMWYAPIWFLIGMVYGFFASSAIPLIEFPSLQDRAVLGWRKEDNYMAQKVMGLVAFANWKNGRGWFEDTLSGFIGGLVAGHNLNKYLAESYGAQLGQFTDFFGTHVNNFRRQYLGYVEDAVHASQQTDTVTANTEHLGNTQEN